MGLADSAKSALGSLKSVGKNPAKGVESALSNYDNVVAETNTGKAGFASNLLGKLGKLGSLQDITSNITSTLTSSVGSFLTEQITKLNALTSGLAAKFGLNGILSKLQGLAAGYLKAGMGMLNDMLSNTLKSLQNAGVNFLSNIVESFAQNLLSTIYIPDKVFCASIKALYYAGADLAYDNHYLRNMCLKRDWSETLEFVDNQYDIKYNCNYTKLSQDLKTASTNSCYKNLLYMYEDMDDQIKEFDKLIEICNGKISAVRSGIRQDLGNSVLEDTITKAINNDESYKSLNEELKFYQDKQKMLKTYMVENLKYLIVDSFSYITSSYARKFFTKYPNILKPKYYGETDDLYGSKYAINVTDCRVMLPNFKGHTVTESDKHTLQNVNNEYLQMSAEAAKIRTQTKDTDAHAGVNQYLDKLRSNTLQKSANRYAMLNTTAINKGSVGVHQAQLSRFRQQNDLKDKVKYRSKNLGTALDNMFNDETDDYVVPRNSNIKSIYIMLASNELWGSDRMVNTAFYNRCQLKTMNNLRAAADKAKGILGSSMFVQSLYGLSNAVDSSACVYTKKVEPYLFDPARNTTVEGLGGMLASNFSFNPDTDEITIDYNNLSETEAVYGELTNVTTSDGTKYDPMQSGPTSLDSNHGSNPSTVEALDSLLDKDLAAKKSVVDKVRYVSNIPMVTKRDSLIKLFTTFNTFMTEKKVPEDERSSAFSYLVKYVFGKNGISEPSALYAVFDTSTNESLNDNSKTIISIKVLELAHVATHTENSSYKGTICDLFYIVAALFELNVFTSGFIQSTFNYDREYLASYFKAQFNNELKYLESINSKDNPNYSTFYSYKDNLTKIITGFDRWGIFGYHDLKKRIQYTNYETGDWKSIKATSNGTFFGGSTNSGKYGIKRLDTANDVIVDTNISDGDWKFINEYCGYTFFINSENKIYYWNGKSVEYTGIDDVDKYEIKTIDNIGLILLCGLSDNGLKYWNGSKFVQVSGNGSKWMYRYIEDGYCIFPTGTPGDIQIVSNNNKFYSPGGKYTFTDVAYISGDVLVTVSTQTGGDQAAGGGSTTQTTSTKTHYMYILAGTTSGVYEMTITDRNLSSATTELVTTYGSNKVYPNRISDTVTTFVNENSAFTVTYNTSKSFSFNGAAGTINAKYEIASRSIDRQFTDITEYYILKDYLLFVDSKDGNQIKNLNSHDINKLTGSFNLSSMTLFEDEKDILYAKVGGNGFYVINGNTFVNFLSGDDDISGWQIKYLNERRFLYNLEKPLGVRYIRDNKAIDCGLSTGFYNIICSGTAYFALSCKNTNKGVKYCEFNSNYTFGDIPDTPVLYGDIGGFDYDPETNRLYLGEERSDLILNIKDIKFDIDEYIFPLYDYQLAQKIQQIQDKRLDAISNSVSNQINSGTPLDEIIKNVSSSIDSANGFAKEMEANSNIYYDLLTYAEAKKEFNVDDNNALNSITLDMINNYDYSGNGNSGDSSWLKKQKSDMMSRYYGDRAVFYIKQDFDDNGNVITEDRNSPEYKAKYEFTSDSFLNSDEDGLWDK